MDLQIQSALKNQVTDAMRHVAEQERIPVEYIRRGVASGRIVILHNQSRSHSFPLGVGEGVRVKVNANIGTSQLRCDIKQEIEKGNVAIRYGADTLMDLSTGGNIDEIRNRFLRQFSHPIGTVPIYQAAVEKNINDMTEDDFFRVIERHVKDGVDFLTLHCGVTLDLAKKLRNSHRILGIVSRGGALHVSWMLHHSLENPLYRDFDYLLEIVKQEDVVISLGDGFRPGCIRDATDSLQIEELLTIGQLVKRAREKGVQVIVEGPGHVPLDQIAMNIKLAKHLCTGAPLYVLGPLPTDIAPGYDHIVAAIGGAVAASSGADFLCYVTPAEHLGLPEIQHVRDGVIATRIAAHIGDMARIPTLQEKDNVIARARANLDWKAQAENAIDPSQVWDWMGTINMDENVCTMCGELCAIKIGRECKEGTRD